MVGQMGEWQPGSFGWFPSGPIAGMFSGPLERALLDQLHLLWRLERFVDGWSNGHFSGGLTRLALPVAKESNFCPLLQSVKVLIRVMAGQGV